MKTWMDEQMDAVLDVKKKKKHLDGTVCSCEEENFNDRSDIETYL